MLNTQVLYHTYKETQRHNIATEGLTQQQVSESIRHNKVTEDQGWVSVNETIRHNKAQESIGFQNISLGYANLEEQTRHNYATEAIGRTQARASLQQAYAATQNAISQRRMADVATWNAGVNAAYVDSQKKLLAQQTKTSAAEAAYKEQQRKTSAASAKQSLADANLKFKESDWYTYNQVLKGIGVAGEAFKDITQAFRNLRQSR